MKVLLSIINLKALAVVAAAILATVLAIEFGFAADFPLTLISVAIIFPIVFSIGGAYKRREVALDHYGTIKAHGRALFLASRDWVGDDKHDNVKAEIKDILGDIFVNIRLLFQAKRGGALENELRILEDFSRLSLFIKEMRERGLSSGETSRSNQYLKIMIQSFEKMKHIFQYRTPKTLRAYSKLFIGIFPVVYAPYFAFQITDIGSWVGWVLPVLFSLVLVSLDNIQDHLENPFDQVGSDDVFINAEKFVESLK